MPKYVCRVLWLLPLLFFLSISAHAYTITGVSGTVSSNVDKRLQELQKIKPLNQYQQDELVTQISNAIKPYGYFNARIKVYIKEKNHALVTIRPGPPVRISALSINLSGPGANNPLLRNLVAHPPFNKGDPLLTQQYNTYKQDLVNTAENLGYLHTSFKKAEVLIDVAHNTAQININFNTGPLYYFGQIQFSPSNINPGLMHRYAPFQPGQVYSTDQILLFNKNLNESGYFNSVVVNAQNTDSTSVPVTVNVQPVPKYSYTLGAGYGTDTGGRGRAGLQVTPVNNLGHKFNALAQGSVSQNALLAQYIMPASNPVTDQYILSGNLSNLIYTTGNSNSLLVSLSEQHNLKDYNRILSLNVLYDRFNYTLQPNESRFLLYPKASFTFSRISSKLFSPSGYSITLNGLGAAKYVFSDINLAIISLDVRAALMLEPLGLRLYGHTFQGLTQVNNINSIPLSLALLLGGTDNLKAYSYNSIGPGKYTSYAGFEIQKRLVKDWYFLGYFDVGAVYNPTPKLTQYDAGGGVMWVSPIGPIKASLAQPIDSSFHRIGGSSPRFVISMGSDL